MIKSVLPASFLGLTSLFLNILFQFLSVRILILHLGDNLFGIFASFLALFSLSDIGIGWLTSGFTQTQLKNASTNDLSSLITCSFLSRFLFLVYSIIASVSVSILFIYHNTTLDFQFLTRNLLLLLIYIVTSNILTVDKITLISINKQSFVYLIESFRFLFSCILLLFIIPSNPSIYAAWFSILFPIFLQFSLLRFITRSYLAKVSHTFISSYDIDLSLRLLRSKFFTKTNLGFTIHGFFLILISNDIFFLSIISKPSSVTNYILLTRIPLGIILIVQRLCQVLYPKFFHITHSTNSPTVIKILLKSVLATYALSLTLSISYLLSAHYIYSFWLGFAPTYSLSVKLFIIVFIIFSSSAYLFSTFLLAAGQISLVISALFLELFIKLIFITFYFKAFDFYAFVFASSLSSLFISSIYYPLLLSRFVRQLPSQT